MKREAIDHPKTYDLMSSLDIPRYAAVGILESLWHFTARFAPDGDISRFRDDQIARAVDWQGCEKTLLDALVTTGWIDEAATSVPHDGVTRRIHDWDAHADRGVHQKLARRGQPFANGVDAKLYNLSLKERPLNRATRVPHDGQARAASVSHPANTQANPPEPVTNTVVREVSVTDQTTVASETSSSPAKSDFEIQAAAAALFQTRTPSTLQESSSSNKALKLAYELSETHPRTGSVEKAVKAIESLGYSDELGDRLRRMHSVYVEHYAKTKPAFVPDLARWLLDGDWRRVPEIPKKTMSKEDDIAAIDAGIKAALARKAKSNGC